MSHRDSTWERLQERWVVGEPLDAREQGERFQRAAMMPEAERELKFYQQAREWLNETTSEEARDNARLLKRVLQDGKASRNPGLRLVGETRAEPLLPAPELARLRTSVPRSAWLVSGALALAATFAIFYSRGLRPSAGQSPIVVAASAPVRCELTSLAGAVKVVPGRGVSGEPLREGSTVSTAAGVACLSIEQSVRVCLPSDSELVLSSLNPRDIRIAIVRGGGIASLTKRAPGSTFSLTGRGVVATAHGTVFALELAAGTAAPEVTVLEGNVEVSYGALRALVGAQTRARFENEGRAPTLVAVDDLQQARLLSWLGGPLPAMQAPAVALLDPPKLGPVAGAPAASSVAERDDAAAGTSRESLFAAARAQAGLGNARAARVLYREILARYPGPSTASVEVVLGNLEMDLDAPDHALRAFDAYLRSGGPLQPEALHGKVRALHALGRKADEAATIRTYLERYPHGFQAPALRRRLADLE